MRRAFTIVLLLAFGVGLAALMSGEVQADPCNGRGKGKDNPADCSKYCPPPPPGYTYFECTKCGCDYIPI